MPGMLGCDSNDKLWRVYRGDYGVLRADGEPSGYSGDWIGTAPLLGAVPVTDDPATFGCLCALAAELHNAPDSYVGLCNITGWTYFVLGAHNEQGAMVTKMFHGETREDAVCAAILGAA